MKSRKSRYNTTLGKLIFIIPILIIGSLVVYAFVELSLPGTLIIRAENSSCTVPEVDASIPCTQLAVQATVDGKSGETPWTLSLVQGNYIVNYTSLQWYYPPSARDISLPAGQTAYAVAVYFPIGKVVQVTPSGFNTTVVTALHGVTEVNFTNPSRSVLTIEASEGNPIILEPGETTPVIFAAAGTYTYTILSTNDVVTVDVS